MRRLLPRKKFPPSKPFSQLLLLPTHPPIAPPSLHLAPWAPYPTPFTTHGSLSSPFPPSDFRMHSASASSLQSFDDDDDDRGPFSDKVLKLTDEIAGLSDEELVQMSAALRKKLGIPEPSAMMPPGGMGMEDVVAPQAEIQEKPVEKTSFDVKLEKFDAPQKIKVIKEVRVITNLGLKEAKELVEKTPAVLKTGVSKEEALQIVEKLKAVGAAVVME